MDPRVAGTNCWQLIAKYEVVTLTVKDGEIKSSDHYSLTHRDYGIIWLIMVSLDKKQMNSLLNSYLSCISGRVIGLVNRSLT